ncbi:HCL054Wp [Eremothecium sinecaudum]|uniref:HCL054Wp n=1 Tax=Eremothecium sinecaudum TaxID=45286 RepID=A0A0X8HRH6_9SACH|nr:HCL054Wp [Eremothecium sinecaudum]AMD20097.1 HCL054Wp [Eremothecium sinecaudum]
MCRTNYVASFFMPLILSSRPYISNWTIISMLLSVLLVYSGSSLYASWYNDPTMFRPNPQDYFRTSLLGFLSPVLIYFVKTFILNLHSSEKFSVLNMAFDYVVTDWFMLLIVIALAYPQVQEGGIGATPLLLGKEDGPILWHIIPRQAYLFGLCWAANELLLSMLGNLNAYEEVPMTECGTSTSLDCKQLLNGSCEELDTLRNSISLSKCMDVRRNSSKISDNIYNTSAKRKKSAGYGSICDTGRIIDDDAVVIAFSTDSMNFLKDLEGRHPTWLQSREIGSRGGRYNHDEYNGVIYFSRISTTRCFWRKLLIANVVVLAYILETVGQALIMSIYFTYVPNHDELFTGPVLYFGKKSSVFFMLTVVLPFSILNFLYHALLYYWNNEPLPNTDPERSSTRQSREIGELFSADPTSLNLISSDPDAYFTVDSNYMQNSLADHDDSNKILHKFRCLVLKWRRLAANSWFSVVGSILWSTTVFTLGVLATRK